MTEYEHPKTAWDTPGRDILGDIQEWKRAAYECSYKPRLHTPTPEELYELDRVVKGRITMRLIPASSYVAEIRKGITKLIWISEES